MVEVTPVLHHSNGGIKINASTEVTTTRSDGTSSIILGLYAAGECTGGKIKFILKYSFFFLFFLFLI